MQMFVIQNMLTKKFVLSYNSNNVNYTLEKKEALVYFDLGAAWTFVKENGKYIFQIISK